MLSTSGACERCGRFICEACDVLHGKHCTACQAALARAAVPKPYRGRQTRSMVVLGLGLALLAAALRVRSSLADEGNRLYLLCLTVAMSFGGVAVLWSGMAWVGFRNAPEPEARSWLSLPVAGGGCLLAVFAGVAILLAGVGSWG